jgi:hypothetical protein
MAAKPPDVFLRHMLARTEDAGIHARSASNCFLSQKLAKSKGDMTPWPLNLAILFLARSSLKRKQASAMFFCHKLT